MLFQAEDISEDFLPILDISLPSIFEENDGLFIKTTVKKFLFSGIKFCRNASKSSDFAVKAICAQIKGKTKESKQIKFASDHLVYATLDYVRLHSQQHFFKWF